MSLDKSYDYTQLREFSVVFSNHDFKVISKPGLPEWDQLLPSTRLVAEHFPVDKSANIILFGCHNGVLPTFITWCSPSIQLSIVDNNFLAIELTQVTLDANGLPNTSNNGRVRYLLDVDLPGSEHQSYDIAIIQMPKGRALARRWLVQARLSLRDRGSLYIAGANKAGIQSTLSDALELFEDGHILGYKKGNRIAHFSNNNKNSNPPDWASNPGIAPGTWYEFSTVLSGHEFKIRSLPGVFSYNHLDVATEMLINTIKISAGMKVLDAGCGYGVIGLIAAYQGADTVELIDNDYLATASANETMKLNKISNIRVQTGDLLKPVIGNKFDLILSNPPFHAGRSVDHLISTALINQAYEALLPGGQVAIVANRFLPYNQLMKHVFGNVSIMAESSKFYVLSSLKLMQ